MGVKAHFRTSVKRPSHTTSDQTSAPKKFKATNDQPDKQVKQNPTGSSSWSQEENMPLSAPPFISYRVFQEVVVPLAYQGINEREMHQVSLEEAEELRQSFAKPGSITFSKTNSNRNHNLTYGEVVPKSIEEEVLPELGELSEGDVFYDLGSGTGKIPLQIALQTSVGRSKGIEYAQARHAVAKEAQDRIGDLGEDEVRSLIDRLPDAYLNDLFPHQDTPVQREQLALSLRKSIRFAGEKLHFGRGDFCREDISDATVIFINNAVFEPDLMLSLVSQLATLPRLRKVVCLRKLCYRHSRRCHYNGSPCCVFGNPSRVKTINPTWCRETTLYTYIKQPTMETWYPKKSTPATKEGVRVSTNSSARRRLHSPRKPSDGDEERAGKTIDFSEVNVASMASSQTSVVEDPYSS